MWTKRLALPLMIVLAVVGCQTNPDIQQLNNKNAQLEQQLASAQGEISRLQQREQTLKGEVAELNRVNNVLGTEKSSRIQESSSLRGQVRKFVQQQIDGLKDFLVDGNLLDYVGGELVARSDTEAKPVTLVDLTNPIPSQGTLTGLGGYFTEPTSLILQVLRPIGDEYVLIWQSQTLSVANAGVNRVSLPVSVGVQKDDVMAYYFPVTAAVGFDSGTGYTLLSRQPLSLGDAVRDSELSGARDRRAYALGVYGLLN